MVESQITTDVPRKRSSHRGFWCLIVTQFQGAFSDLTLKTLVTFLIMGLALSPEKRDSLVSLVGALFAMPFIVFSMAGGFFADDAHFAAFEFLVLGAAVFFAFFLSGRGRDVDFDAEAAFEGADEVAQGVVLFLQVREERGDFLDVECA